MHARNQLIVIDLAVPHDVKPSAAELPRVDLYDLYRISDKLRHAAPDGAFACDGDTYAAIQEQVIRFAAGSRAVRRGAMIQSVVAAARTIREVETERAARSLRRHGAGVQDLLPVLDALANAIAKKSLHASITYLRNIESDDSAASVLRLIGHESPEPIMSVSDISGNEKPLAA